MTRLDYLKLLTEQIRCKKARLMIEEEYQAHIDDQKLDFMAQGMSEAEAFPLRWHRTAFQQVFSWKTQDKIQYQCCAPLFRQ